MTDPELLRAVETFIRRFVVLPPSTLLPVSLWTIATHCFEAFDCFPYLAITSPTKGCGKTRLTEILDPLACRSSRVSGISEAALYRLIEQEQPTLLLDEAEALRDKANERGQWLRGLLNAGNRRGANVLRMGGAGMRTVEKFKVCCPKVFCCIGQLPDTLADRSIAIFMQRRQPSDSIERFLVRRVAPEAEQLHRETAAWAAENAGLIGEAYQGLDVSIIQGLTDRDVESWEPLFAVCFAADKTRIEELRRDAEHLSTEKAATDTDNSLSLRLLADVRVCVDGKPVMLTSELLARLKGLEESPWASEVELSARKLARFLRLFGVEPQRVRVQGASPGSRGYFLRDLLPAFSRYLPPNPPQAPQAAKNAASEQFFNPPQGESVADTKSDENPQEHCLVADVADTGKEEGR